MKKINFTKMVASGNDFIVIGAGIRSSMPVRQAGGYPIAYFAQKACDRKYGIGADGLLLLERSGIADIRMRIFNADGSEAEMCGNGARCASLFLSKKLKKQRLKIETKAGVILSEAKGESIKIRLTPPQDIRLDIPIRVEGRPLRVNFVNTGVPHVVIFCEGLEDIDVHSIGKAVRFHR
ncbi:MAG: diaminopimelate epimerase, partial [Candidatus Omnitrophica bacterium]|nr:diaminopimelate epimerase [Candidatus Omnitrophota bacterium]